MENTLSYVRRRHEGGEDQTKIRTTTEKSKANYFAFVCFVMLILN